MRLFYKLVYLIEKSFWQQKAWYNYLLLPLSEIYNLISNFRFFIQIPKKFKPLIICVGNQSVGGSGKTPTIIRLAQLMRDKYKVAIVTKGYKAKSLGRENIIIVDLHKHSFKDVGDEAILLAQTAKTYICKKRAKAVKEAESDNYEIILLDDGIQDNTIKKDWIILIHQPQLKNNFLIPAGPMRETLYSSLNKCDVIMLQNKNILYDKTTKIILYFSSFINNINQLEGNAYILLCAIAQPQRVLELLKKTNLEIKKICFFPDHYCFENYDLQYVYDLADKYNCKVLTTTKDFVRLDCSYHDKTQVIEYEIRFENEESLHKKICDLKNLRR